MLLVYYCYELASAAHTIGISDADGHCKYIRTCICRNHGHIEISEVCRMSREMQSTLETLSRWSHQMPPIFV